jgi:tetratricopeptide (TPR) repeat protein
VAKRALDEGVTDRLYRETGGNALFVIETVRAGEEFPQAVAEELRKVESLHNPALPPKVYAVIEERLARLSPQARTLANLAAVVGRAFRIELLAKAGEQDEEGVTCALEELWQRGIVREHSQGYDFSHDKIREVAYAEIKPMRRRLFHRQIGQAMEELQAHRVAEIAGELAVHFEQGGQAKKARAYYQQAGERALATFANDTALAYFTLALALTPESENESEKVARYELLRLRRTVYQRQADRDAEAAELATMERVAGSLEDEQESLRCRAELAAYDANYKSLNGDYAGAIASCRVAIELAQASGRVDVEATAYERWGFVCWAQADYPLALELLFKALALAKRCGMRALQADCLGVISACGLYGGTISYEQAMVYLGEALAIFQETGAQIGEALTLNRIGYCIVAEGDGPYDEAESLYLRSLRISQRIHHPVQQSIALGNMGVLYNSLGDYQRSLVALRQAFALTERTRDIRQQGAILDYLGFTYFSQGDFENAQQTLEAAYNLLHARGIRLWLVKTLSDLGLLHHCLGNDARALATLEDALATVRSVGYSRQEARILTRRGHVYFALGQRENARESYQQALALHEKLGQKNRRLEPLAGLARIAHLEGDSIQAQGSIERIFAHLQEHPLERTEDGLRVYLTCFELFQAYQDARAQRVLEMAYAQLQARAATIETEETRKLFWNMPSHRTVLDAIEHTSMRHL